MTTAIPLDTSHLSPPPPDKPAAVLLLVGAFSPITNAHLRLLQATRDTLEARGTVVCGAFISPASDFYHKQGLAPAHHRLAMCRLAVASIPWVGVDDWEASQPRFVRTYEVAERVIATVASELSLYLVCGSDLVNAMADTTRWPPWSVARLRKVSRFAIKNRDGQEQHFNDKTIQIEPWVGDLSSSVVRRHVGKGWSIRFMAPEAVVDYIQQHRLYVPI